MTEQVGARLASDRRAANFSAHEALEIFALCLVAQNADGKATSSCHVQYPILTVSNIKIYTSCKST